jgi:hypothetical protein
LIARKVTGGLMTGSPVLEVKRTLDGQEQTFSCTLLHAEPGWLAVRYVLPGAATVGQLALPAGAETVAHYWPDRPYTAYHWRRRDGMELGVYLNAADQVQITPGLVRWTDLALDLLVTPDGRVEVLDEDEARRAPAWAQPRIARSRAALDGHAGDIAGEVRRLTEVALASGRPGYGGGARLGSSHRRSP